MSKYLGTIVGLTAAAGLAAPLSVSAAGSENLILEEILVTSQKREQNLQNVPISVSAMTGEDLDAVGAYNFEDYVTRVPNVTFGAKSGGSDGRTGGRNISIRGISGKNTTAMYIDEVPLPEAIDLKIIDVNRVEVLRGPQGTLYGASSMGGAMRIITNQPNLQETTGNARVTLSNVKEGDENYRLDGMFNVSIVEDTLAFRVAGFYDDQSGIYDRIITDPASAGKKENVDDTESYGFHAALGWQPTDRLNIVPKIIYQKIESDGFPWADADIDEFDQYRIHGVEEPFEDELKSYSLTINYDWDVGTLTSATSYVERDAHEVEDFTEFAGEPDAFGLMPPPPLPITAQDEFSKFVQELRFASSLEGSFQYVAGVFYSKEELDSFNFTYSPGFEAYAAEQYGAPPGTPVFGGTDLIFASAGVTEVEEYAVFGELTYDIGESWTALLGLRYYDTTVEDDLAADGIINGGPSTSKGEHAEDGVNPKLNVSYQANDDVMIYGTAAKGFRSGGTNGNSQGVASNCQAELAELGITGTPDTFDEDSLWSFELGSKATLADGRVRINGALFYVQWDDLQQNVILDCGFRVVSNVGEAESLGGEVEITARPVDAVNLTLGIGYVDATITDAGGNPAVEDGDRVLEVPEWTYSGSADYTWDLSSGAALILRGDFRGASESYTSFDTHDELRTRESFTVVDFRLTYVTERWQLAGFVDNASDERVNYSDGVSIAQEVPGRPRIATNRPRTVGFSVKADF